MTDPRIANLIRINDSSPTGRTRFAGAWRGDSAGPLHGVVREVVRAAEGLLTNAHDIRGNRNFGPVEAGTRLREAAGPTLKVLDGAASKLRSLKANLRQQVQALDPVRSYEKSGHWQAGFDLRLIDWYHALPTGERAALEHQMRLNPAARLDLAEALLRVPREIAGLDEGVRAEIRHGLQRTMRHADFEALDVQLDQLAVAETVLRQGIEACRETTGSMSDLIQHAPEAFKFSTSAEDAEPVRWTPPATEAAPLVSSESASDAGAGNAEG